MTEVIQKLLFTRFPYLFWFLRENENEVRIDFENNKLITSNDETFVLRPMSKLVYMCCKYLPVALIFAAIFNTNDLNFGLKIKILEYSVALILAVIVFFANRVFIFLSFVAFLASGYFYIASVPFVLKYFFLFVALFTVLFDKNKRIFSIKRNDKIVAQIILEQEK